MSGTPGKLGAEARAEAQRILAAAAKRLLAEKLDRTGTSSDRGAEAT